MFTSLALWLAGLVQLLQFQNHVTRLCTHNSSKTSAEAHSGDHHGTSQMVQ